MRSIFVCVAIVISLAACEGTRAVTAGDKQELAEHEAQWDGRSFHSYRFDYSEAQLNSNFNVRITVLNDTVATAIDTTTGKAPPVPRSWPTMDDLFGEATFFANNGDYTLSIDYDDTFGSITLISAQPSRAGGGFLARVANLQPLE
jgi:hypothetical protein